MRDLILFALAGFAASLVDGALGMGFGPTSSSILLGGGLAPAAVSTCVNIAKVATGIAAGISHWRFQNIDRKLVLNLAIPGCIGAVAGVTILSNINGAALKPFLALLLTVIGLRILIRFARAAAPKASDSSELDPQPVEPNARGVRVAGLLGGVTNGIIGAWGPVVTPYLLHRNVKPRFAIGSVNTAEIAVASASVFSLLASVGRGGLNVAVLVAMLVGGVLAAPVAAWLIRFVPAKPMGIAVAALLLLTNARELAAWAGVRSGVWLAVIYLGVVAFVTLIVLAARARAVAAASAPAERDAASVAVS